MKTDDLALWAMGVPLLYWMFRFYFDLARFLVRLAVRLPRGPGMPAMPPAYPPHGRTMGYETFPADGPGDMEQA